MENWRDDGKLEGLRKIGGMMENWRDDGRMYRSLVSSLVAGATGGLPLQRLVASQCWGGGGCRRSYPHLTNHLTTSIVH